MGFKKDFKAAVQAHHKRKGDPDMPWLDEETLNRAYEKMLDILSFMVVEDIWDEPTYTIALLDEDGNIIR